MESPGQGVAFQHAQPAVILDNLIDESDAPMPVLCTRLDPQSPEFRDTVAYHRGLVDELDARLASPGRAGDRKSTRLNSSHSTLSRMPSSA